MKNLSKNKKIPLVSVIIPVFNGSVFVEETVESVQKSTFRNFEILLVDDGSTDESKKICYRLEKRYKNVKFYSFEKNKGLGRVLNFALRQAKGTYIARLNQDDLMVKNRLKIQVEFLEKNPEVVAVGSWIRLFSRTRNDYNLLKFLKTNEEIKKVWYIVSPFADPSVMYRKEIALKVGGYWQSMWPADDTHLWYRMAQKGKLANIQKALAWVRYHDGAASLIYGRKMAISTYKMHLWTNKYIKRASFFIHFFWLGQLISGLLLPAKFNWFVYRVIKKGIDKYQLAGLFLTKTLTKIKTVKKVAIQPIRLRLSGA